MHEIVYFYFSRGPYDEAAADQRTKTAIAQGDDETEEDGTKDGNYNGEEIVWIEGDGRSQENRLWGTILSGVMGFVK